MACECQSETNSSQAAVNRSAKPGTFACAEHHHVANDTPPVNGVSWKYGAKAPKGFGNVLSSSHMSRTITLIPGDGIGPEVTKATQQVLQAAGVSIDWEQHVAGSEALSAPVMPCRRRSSTRSSGTRSL